MLHQINISQFLVLFAYYDIVYGLNLPIVAYYNSESVNWNICCICLFVQLIKFSFYGNVSGLYIVTL